MSSLGGPTLKKNKKKILLFILALSGMLTTTIDKKFHLKYKYSVFFTVHIKWRMPVRYQMCFVINFREKINLYHKLKHCNLSQSTFSYILQLILNSNLLFHLLFEVLHSCHFSEFFLIMLRNNLLTESTSPNEYDQKMCT